MSTKIAWTDETLNVVTGCSKVSDGCRNCYAERLSHRFGWTKQPWGAQHAAENVKLHPERLDCKNAQLEGDWDGCSPVAIMPSCIAVTIQFIHFVRQVLTGGVDDATVNFYTGCDSSINGELTDDVGVGCLDDQVRPDSVAEQLGSFATQTKQPLGKQIALVSVRITPDTPVDFGGLQSFGEPANHSLMRHIHSDDGVECGSCCTSTDSHVDRSFTIDQSSYVRSFLTRERIDWVRGYLRQPFGFLPHVASSVIVLFGRKTSVAVHGNPTVKEVRNTYDTPMAA